MNNISKLVVSNEANPSTLFTSERFTRLSLHSCKRGWELFQLQPLGKEPIEEDWQQKATKSQETIKSWWTKSWDEPENLFCNIGIKTGIDSNLLIIELGVDRSQHPSTQGEESWQTLLDEYNEGVELETFMVGTPSGGRHLYFQYPKDLAVDITTGNNLLPGLHFYGEGGYVTGCGSVLEIDGKLKRYIVMNKTAVAPCPSWLVTLLTEPKANSGEQGLKCISKGEKALEDQWQSFKKSGRNKELNAYANDLFGRGLYRKEVALLVEKQAMVCIPPFPLEEVQATVESAFKAFQNRSRSLTEEEAIQLVNKDHAVILSPPLIIYEKQHLEGNYLVLEYMDKGGLNLKFQTTRVIVASTGKEMTADKVWIHSTRRRSYESIVFDPANPCEGHYNLFTGFARKPVKGNCDLFLEHIQNIVCDGNSLLSEYVLNWMAHLFQKPAELPEAALILKGQQGTGKGTVANALIKLLGPHALPLTKMEQLTGRFDSHLADKLFVFLDEVRWDGSKKDVGQLKALITEKQLTVEAKGKDCYTVRNYKRLIIASNEERIVHIDPDDRRFTVLEVSNSKNGDSAYFKALYDQLDNGGYEALMAYLLERDISNFSPRKKPFSPHNTAHKLGSMNSIQKWWLIRLMNFDSDNWPNMEDKKALYKNYTIWCKENRHFKRVDQAIFGRELNKLVDLEEKRLTNRGMGGAATSNRTRSYIFPDYQTCREKFKKVFQCKDEIFGDEAQETYTDEWIDDEDPEAKVAGDDFSTWEFIDKEAPRTKVIRGRF